jgi:hypothetical protein
MDTNPSENLTGGFEQRNSPVQVPAFSIGYDYRVSFVSFFPRLFAGISSPNSLHFFFTRRKSKKTHKTHLVWQ